MAATYSQIKSGLDAIANRIRAASDRLASAKSAGQFVVDDLNNLGSEYGQLITDINQAAAAAPNDVALQNAKAEAALLVAEYNAKKTKAQAIVTAAG